MRDCVRRKLDVIQECYPPKRLERSRQRWQNLWAGNLEGLDHYPFTYSPVKLNYYDIIEPPEDRLQHSLDEFIVRGRFDDDFIPAFFPGCSTATIPNMFGAEPLQIAGDHTCKPIVARENDIENLPEPKIGPVARNWLDMQQYFLDETEGAIPVHVIDMQGPGDVSGKLWNYQDLMVSMYTAPDLFHLLMDKVDMAFLQLWQIQQQLLGASFQPTHLFGWSWMPLENIASLSFDSIVMISPENFKELYCPHLGKLAKSFRDGIVVHSCGNFSQHNKVLTKCDFIKGLNFGQMRLAEIVDAGFSNQQVFITMENIDNLEMTLALVKEHRLRADMTFSGFWPDTEPEAWTETELKELLARHDEVKEKMSIRQK